MRLILNLKYILQVLFCENSHDLDMLLLPTLFTCLSLVSAVPTPSFSRNSINGSNVSIYSPLAFKSVILFFTGFASNMPSDGYSEFLSILSIHSNSIVVAWDGLPQNPFDFSGLQSRAELIYTWVKSTYNFKIYFMAHSSGAQIAILLSRKHESDGLLLLDPVDLQAQSVFKTDLIVSSPLLIISTGLCQVSSFPLFPSCCPIGYTSKLFLDKINGASLSKFSLNATYYGHSDILNGFFSGIRFCAGADSSKYPIDMYHRFLVDVVGGFLEIFRDEKCLGIGFFKDKKFKVDSTVEYQLGDDYRKLGC